MYDVYWKINIISTNKEKRIVNWTNEKKILLDKSRGKTKRAIRITPYFRAIWNFIQLYFVLAVQSTTIIYVYLLSHVFKFVHCAVLPLFLYYYQILRRLTTTKREWNRIHEKINMIDAEY